MKRFGSVTIESLGDPALCAKQPIQLADGDCFSFSQLSRAAKWRGGAGPLREIPRSPAPDPATLVVRMIERRMLIDKGRSKAKRAATRR